MNDISMFTDVLKDMEREMMKSCFMKLFSDGTNTPFARFVCALIDNGCPPEAILTALREANNE